MLTCRLRVCIASVVGEGLSETEVGHVLGYVGRLEQRQPLACTTLCCSAG